MAKIEEKDLTGLKWVIQVAHPKRDKAINMQSEGVRDVLTEYARKRTTELLSKIEQKHLKTGAHLVKWGVVPLSVAAWTAVKGCLPSEAPGMAFLAAARKWIDGNGTEHAFDVKREDGFTTATDVALTTAFEVGGGALIDEIGTHVIERAKYGDADGEDETFAPFHLGLGYGLHV